MHRLGSSRNNLFLDAAELNRSYLLDLLASCEEMLLPEQNGTIQLVHFGSLPDVFLPHWLQLYNFFFDVVLVGSILLAGVTGNVLSCFVLIRDRSHGTTSLILTSLAICDTLFLIGCLFFQSLRTLSYFTLWTPYMNMYAFGSKILYASGMTVRMLRNWMVVLVSAERWVAVCKPLHAPSICTRKKARLAITILAILCILYNLPNFFIVDAIPLFCHGDSSTVVAEETVSLDELPVGVLIYHSALRPWVQRSYLFKLIYRLIGYTILIVFLPTVIIAVLNALLIRGIKYANARRAQIMARVDSANRHLEQVNSNTLRIDKSRNPTCSANASQLDSHVYFVRVEKSTRSRTGEVNRLCVGVIVIYLVCELPAVGYQVIHLLQHRAAIELTKPVTNALVCLNSGVNFFVYVFLGRRFRSQLRGLFRQVCCRWKQPFDANHTHTVHSPVCPSSLGQLGGMSNSKAGEQLELKHHSSAKGINAETRENNGCSACLHREKRTSSFVELPQYHTVTHQTEI